MVVTVNMANASDPMNLMSDLNTHIKRFVQRFGHDTATCFAVRKNNPSLTCTAIRFLAVTIRSFAEFFRYKRPEAFPFNTSPRALPEMPENTVFCNSSPLQTTGSYDAQGDS